MTNQIDKAPVGATHRYFHGPDVDWYCYTDRGLYRWCHGSWCASIHKTIEELANSCPLGRLEAIPAMPAQPAEDDLTWLARNAHKWPDGDGITQLGRGCSFFDTGVGRSVHVYAVDGSDYTTIKEKDWLARRAELQKKPSWKDAPAQATCMAQEPRGVWTFFACQPSPSSPVHDAGWRFDGFQAWDSHMRGEVLGDWRDTLEQRPTDLSSAAVIKRLDEATQTVLAAVPALMDEKFHFDPEPKPVSVSNESVPLEHPVVVAGTGNGSASESTFLIGRVIDLLRTSVGHFSADELSDLNELTGTELTKRDAAVCGGQKYLDATWFERGALPPVGARVQWRPGSAGQWEHDSWIDVDVISHAGDGDIVIKWDGEAGNNKELVSVSQETFRPVRTERDVLIEIIKKTDDTDDRIADAILAAGFKRGGV